jgi:general L-amino acid transport system permease protein
MAANAVLSAGEDQSKASFFYDPQVRSVIYQVVTAVIFVVFVYWVWGNTLENLKRANIASGFGFLNGRAGFDVGQKLIAFTSDSTYGRALVVGLLNTLLVAACGVITASIIGFIVGIGRLSRNWLIAKLSLIYVEIFRNIPPLLVIFFWYKGVLSVLPQPRDSIIMPFSIFLNNRGLAFPKPIWGDGAGMIPIAFVIGIILAVAVSRWASARQAKTGQIFPSFLVGLGLILGLPILTFLVLGAPLSFDYPVEGKFNLTGGSVIGPEFVSLYLALSFYTASFIAEIVRSGIRSVSTGQTEAAFALGLQPNITTRLVVVPQAMRVIIPPLTSQYLNLTKNSSLAIAVGFSDLVSVGGTILNQTGHAVEIVAIWMAVYLGISITTSMFMNWFNARMALVER